jgi:hypothetical protein
MGQPINVEEENSRNIETGIGFRGELEKENIRVPVLAQRQSERE